MKKTVVAAHALIKRGNRFLITKRSPDNDYMPAVWDIPGGSLEFGEDIIKALRREVFEEVNLKVKHGKIILAYGYQSNLLRHQFQLVYECKYLSGQIELNPKEHSEYRWVKLSELKNLKKIAFLRALYRKIK